jgi:hypothetical protein
VLLTGLSDRHRGIHHEKSKNMIIFSFSENQREMIGLNVKAPLISKAGIGGGMSFSRN